jgi:hypothetical protein
VQLLAAYGAGFEAFTDAAALLEVFAYAVFLELDDALAPLLAQCAELPVDLDRTLSQGALLPRLLAPAAASALLSRTPRASAPVSIQRSMVLWLVFALTDLSVTAL